MPLRTKSQAPKRKGPASRFVKVNGVRLHFLVAGTGDPVVLLHGYAETSHMWRPLIAELATTHTVIAPDLRGAGESSTPTAGYTKAVMAQDIYALVRKLGYERIRIVGHDIGLMVAYAYAAQHPSEVERIALMDAFLPGVGAWRDVWLMRGLWHFHFYGKTPLALVKGRERIYFEHFWNDFAADARHSVTGRDRRLAADCLGFGECSAAESTVRGRGVHPPVRGRFELVRLNNSRFWYREDSNNGRPVKQHYRKPTA
jgi:pimeloyl-ACP methyl ester carboxylesterase